MDLKGYVLRNADKVLHFAIGNIAASIGVVFTLWLSVQFSPLAWLVLHLSFAGFLASAIVGVAKELWDKATKQGNSDPWDFVATTLGCVPVILPIIAINNL